MACSLRGFFSVFVLFLILLKVLPSHQDNIPRTWNTVGRLPWTDDNAWIMSGICNGVQNCVLIVNPTVLFIHIIKAYSFDLSEKITAESGVQAVVSYLLLSCTEIVRASGFRNIAAKCTRGEVD